VVAGLWLAAGLPLGILLTSAHYPWFLTPWHPLLVVFLAVLMPSDFSGMRLPVLGHVFAGALLLATAVCSLGHFSSSITFARGLGRQHAYLRQTYDQVAEAILSQPAPRHYGLFFYECNAPFWCQAFFNRHAHLEHPLFFMAIHDSYFQSFGGRSAADIAATLIERIEAYPDALAVAYCEPADQMCLPGDLKPRDASGLAAEVFTTLNNHLHRSPHWQAVRRLDLEAFRPVYLFRYSPRPLGSEEKWREVQPSGVGERGASPHRSRSGDTSG
jgi:hypothetical protein